MNRKRLVMFMLCELQRSCLILAVRGLELVTDEVPEQSVVSPFFFRRLMIFCPHVVPLSCCPQPKIEMALNYHGD